MAFWNAPLSVPNHEVKACAAALAMIDCLEMLNRERQEEATSAGQPFLPFRIGIGINTGRCVVGNLGSDLAVQLFGPGRPGKCCFPSGGADEILRCSDYHWIENRGEG